MHEDLGVTSMFGDVFELSKQSSLKMLNELGDVTVFSVLYPHIRTWNEGNSEFGNKDAKRVSQSSPSLHLLLEQIKLYQYAERAGQGTIIRKNSDLEKEGLKFLIALEGTDALTDPYDVFLLKDLNVLSVGLTWNYDTKFAASCMSKKDYGLTGSGEELVEICNHLGMAVDLAHASKNTIIETANLSKLPVIVSHTNVKQLHDHRRNLDDETIEAVVKNGGIIGITGIPPTLSDSPDISDMVKHAEYVGENFGWDHVGLGTDFLGIETTPKGFDTVKKVEDLSNLLGKHSDEVMWKNSLRVLKEIIK